jgi:hypothetical protein
METQLTGRYVDKRGALQLLQSMNISWTKRQIDWTAKPDATGHRKWPWFLDTKGILRIDEGFILSQFQNEQKKALQQWIQYQYKN